MQCYHLASRWKYMHIKWLSQCQSTFTAVPGAGRGTFKMMRQAHTLYYKQYQLLKTGIDFRMV